MSNNAQQNLLSELGKLFEPVVATRGEPGRLFALFAELGWDLRVVLGPNSDPFVKKVEAIGDAVDKIQGWVDRPPSTLGELCDALTTVKGAMLAVREISGAVGGIQLQGLAALPGDLLSYLVGQYLYERYPVLFRLCHVLTLIEGEVTPVVAKDGVRARTAVLMLRLRPENLSKLLSDPVTHLKGTYLPRGLPDRVAAEAAAAVLFGRLGPLLAQLRADPVVGRGASPLRPVPELEARLATTMTVSWELPGSDVAVEMGASLKLVAANEGGPGLFVSPFVGAALERYFADWMIQLRAAADLDGFLILPGALKLAGTPSPGQDRVEIDLQVEKLAPEGQAFLVGSTTGTRLEVGRFRVSCNTELSTSDQDYGFLIEAGSSALVVSASDGDGFLQKVLPADGLRTSFELGFGWSRRNGVHFQGGAGLEATLPVNATLLGLLSIDSVYLSVRTRDTDVLAVVSTTVKVRLGPISAVVERIGLEAVLRFPPEGGNLGVADLAVAFKPPNGVALVVDAPAIVGGGYLFFDEQKSQYAGVLELELAKTIAIKAIGLLTTRMPDGSRGFSLLVIITAEGFAPIQLGFGFKLTGIGGLLGINRTVAVDTLRAGIKAGTLGSILFPTDPVRNAPRIVSDVGTVFPPAAGRYVFGPMVMIEWGTPSLLKLELGVVLELPDPVRLLILGRVKAALPDEQNALVQIRMDALGVIDFAASQLSLDATLYDSRLSSFVLTGDMAMRVNWGKSPSFLLAVGGWNPGYTAPAGFPTLGRLALTLPSSADARLRLESYLAITSNTLQFGARLDFYFAEQPFSLDGHLGFDALFHFNPFSFIADLSASVALRMDGEVLLCVALDMTLTGPSPWHVWGKAQFSILSIKQAISFDAKFGPDQRLALPDPVEVTALLTAALGDARNWSGGLPAGERPLVTFRPFAATTEVLRIHPLAEVAVRERVVPLDMPITKFGNAPVSGSNRFSLKAVRSDDGRDIPFENISDSFAPAQFVEMSDDQKLSSPAFTQQHAGIRFTSGEFAYNYEPTLDAAITYDTLLILPGQPAQTLPPYALPSAALDGAAMLGAAAQAAARLA